MKSPKSGFQPGENDEGDNKTSSPIRQLEHRQLPYHELDFDTGPSGHDVCQVFRSPSLHQKEDNIPSTIPDTL